MNNLHLRIAGVTLWAIWAASPGGLAQGTTPPEPLIRKIEVVGNRRVSAQTIIDAITTRQNDRYSAKDVDHDIERIFALGFFDDIKAKVEGYQDGLKLIFEVEERRTVASVGYLGRKKISKRTLGELCEVKKGDYLKEYLVKLDETKIREAYLEKGFQFAQVTHKLEEVEDGVKVVYHIKVGPRVRIKRILCEGNVSVETKKLLKVMSTKRKRFFFFAARFREGVFKEDLHTLAEHYRDEGFLDVKVEHSLDYQEKNEKKTYLYITLRFTEGQRYLVESVSVSGTTIFTEEEVVARLGLKEGEPFSPTKLREAKRALGDLYGEQGFISAEIKSKTAFAADAPLASVAFSVEEKERAYIDEVKISGNEKTRDNVIRRVLTFYPGERVDTRKIRDSQRRLENTGYFDFESPRPVAVDLGPGQTPNTRNVLVDVVEGRTGLMRFAMGASSNYGLFGELSLLQKNFDITDLPESWGDVFRGQAFVGAGQTMEFTLRPGKRYREYSARFFEPYIADSDYSFGIEAFRVDRARRDWDEGRTGLEPSVGKRLTRDTTLTLVVGAELIDVDRIERDAPRDAFEVEGNNTKFKLGLILDHDRRNSIRVPSKGYRLQTSGEVSTGDVKIARWQGQGKKYFTVADVDGWGRHILSLGGVVGVVDSYSGDVPIFERFFAGGASYDAASLRGFEYRRVGPVDTRVSTRPHDGGEVKLLGTIEYSIPLVKEVVRLHAFADTGKVDEDLNDLNLDELRASFGVGMRFYFPYFLYLPISLDFGFPFAKEDDDERETFSFTVGGSTKF